MNWEVEILGLVWVGVDDAVHDEFGHKDARVGLTNFLSHWYPRCLIVGQVIKIIEKVYEELQRKNNSM